MLSLTHAAVGGAVGSFVASPVIAFGFGIVSHLIVDKVPHFWPKSSKSQLKIIILDSIFSIVMLSYLFTLSNDWSSPIFWGAAGGVFVDFMLVLVFKIHPKLWNSKLRIWHSERQPHKTELVYLLTDVIQIIIGLMIIFAMK